MPLDNELNIELDIELALACGVEWVERGPEFKNQSRKSSIT